MFIKDGFVYGGSSPEGVKVTAVKPLENRMMILTFNSGEQRLFDAACLTGQVFEPLKDDGIFMNPALDHGVVTWFNGSIDCAPEYMYENSFEYPAITA